MKTILGVPYFKQHLPYSCLPAAIRMVLGYYGDEASEKELYRKGKLPGHPGTWDAALAPFLITRGYLVHTYWNGDLKAWGLSKRTSTAFNKAFKIARTIGLVHHTGANIRFIESHLREGDPVIAEVDIRHFYGIAEAFTHIVLIVGMDQNTFYIHDPQPLKGGAYLPVSKKHFAKSWTTLLGRPGRSLLIITKAQD